MTYLLFYYLSFTPLEIIPRCSLRARGPLGRRLSEPEALWAGGSPSQRLSLRGRSPSGAEPEPEAAAGLGFRIIPGSAP